MIKIVFTLTQTPDSANLYLYPDAVGSGGTDLTASAGNNYDCVDEIWHSPNDDTDYVYSDVSTSQYDWYGLPDHTTETGTINYVSVISRPKSCNATQSSSGTYKLWIGDGTSTTSSINFAPITTSYAKYYHNFASSPSIATWDWNAIDNLEIGFECSSPSVGGVSCPGTHTVVLNPSGASQTNLECVGTNWQYVSDNVDANYVEKSASPGAFDTYTTGFTSESTHVGSVCSVEIFRKAQQGTAAAGATLWKLTTYGLDFQGGSIACLSSGWRTDSTVTDTNPHTGSAWTWDEIEKMAIGVYCEPTASWVRCTKLYAVVTYAGLFNPQVRTTQCYAVVNYTAPTTTVTLTTPDKLSISHGRNIERFLFAAGDYEIIDTGRASKTLSMSGIETTTADTKMQGVRDMMHYGTLVTVAGLPDTNLNTDYYITSFDCEDISYGTVMKYRWNLQLEEA